ncbi:MAG TPA: glycosyl hydrolase family 8, partial [Bacteroidales bacterium]|nr:glycosyl hydrolase family 8 [Bacteroidales bacterium]
MKTRLLLLVVCSFAAQFVFAQGINSSSPKVPFGSRTSYPYGIMPTNLPTSGTYGKSQAAADAYTAWKTNLTETCSNGIRVKFDTQSETVSEGIAYGMLLAAYAADKTLFDGLWK